MSYCVHCGVKLSDYHEECPLCRTKVFNPNVKVDPETRDFPKYREHLKVTDPHHMKSLLAGMVISFAVAIYIVVLLLINYLVNGTISWSLIPTLSLLLVWFGVGLPFLRQGQTGFRLYTADSFAIAIYLLALNFVISGNLSWAKYASPGVIFIWMIMAGILGRDHIKRRIPLVLYYIIGTIVFTAFYAFLFTNNQVIINVILPIYLVGLFFTIITYLFSKAMVFDIYKFLAIVFMNVALSSFSIDMILTHYFHGSFNPTWSIIVLIALVPLSLAGLMMRNLRTLRTFIAKKFHH